MRIGDRVKKYINAIFLHCETVDHSELNSLLDLDYSKKRFG